jgi:hypothetical protein
MDSEVGVAMLVVAETTSRRLGLVADGRSAISMPARWFGLNGGVNAGELLGDGPQALGEFGVIGSA